MPVPVRIVAVLSDLEPKALIEIGEKTFVLSRGAVDYSREISGSRRRALIAKHSFEAVDLEAPTVEHAVEMVASFALDPAELLRGLR